MNRDRSDSQPVPTPEPHYIGAKVQPSFQGWIDFDAVQRATPTATALIPSDSGERDRVQAPGVDVAFAPDRVRVARTQGCVTLVSGQPRDGDFEPVAAERIAERLARDREAELASWLRGRYSIVHLDMDRRRAIFLTDRFSAFPVCYSHFGTRVAFSDRANAVPVEARQIDLQSVYDYLYFHVIPAPRTIFSGIWRVEAATQLQADEKGVHKRALWSPTFSSGEGFDRHVEEERLRFLLQSAVRRSTLCGNVGAYLSGGTDSSTVAGTLARVTGRAAKTYSIGFNAAGYDEMTYARIAAKHFGTEHHELYVTPSDVATSLPIVAAGYDQPFGNSSAIPAYLCARMARADGIDLLLAGDGGDELFGGNLRYARQKVFEAYWTLPPALRTGLIEPCLLGWDLPARLPIVSKAASYVRQARVPMPARTETYNQLQRLGACAVLTDAVLAAVDTEAPPRLQSEVYENTEGAALVNRMLAYDWRFTLADNDLLKVTTTAAMAGVDVGFPLLDDALVEFSTALPADEKVRRLRLRHFFKETLRDFLPEEIISKKKHGFGLPIGIWLLREPELLAMAKRSMESLVARRLIRPEFVQNMLASKLAEHAGFFGEFVWVLVVLEHWLSVHAPQFSLDTQDTMRWRSAIY